MIEADFKVIGTAPFWEPLTQHPYIFIIWIFILCTRWNESIMRVCSISIFQYQSMSIRFRCYCHQTYDITVMCIPPTAYHQLLVDWNNIASACLIYDGNRLSVCSSTNTVNGPHTGTKSLFCVISLRTLPTSWDSSLITKLVHNIKKNWR